MFDLIIVVLGIFGLFLVGSSVLLESLNKLPKNHKMFILLNLLGSILLCINAFFTNAYIFFYLNLFLILVNSYASLKIYKILK